jgi:hypothetical protein
MTSTSTKKSFRRAGLGGGWGEGVSRPPFIKIYERGTGDPFTPAFGPLSVRKSSFGGLKAKTLSLMALYCVMSATAVAQQQPASTAAPPGSGATATPGATTTPGATAAPTGKPGKATAQSEAGEPRADTSSPANPGETTDRPAATSSAGRPAPAATAPASGRTRAAGAGRTSADGAATGSAAGQKSADSAKSGSKVDRLQLGTATVTGDREQPKVMYIVPWKQSDIGDLAGKPMNSLVDEILAPVDRDVFKREVVYYHAVQAEGSQNAAPPKPAQQGEK